MEHLFDTDFGSCTRCGISLEGRRFACRVASQQANLQPILQGLVGVQNQLLGVDNNQDADVNNAANLVNQAVSLLQNVLQKPGP